MHFYVTLLFLLCWLSLFAMLCAQPSILTPPVDATVCLNSTAEFNCSTDGQALVWRVNGTGADAFPELKAIRKYLNPGVEEILIVPGMYKFNYTTFTCVGGAVGSLESAMSDPAYLTVQGPPSPPSELTATPLNETSIKLTWSVPPGVLDEELISYLVEVRNESGGLIVLSETDGTEYTFTMDNPDPCDLYSFTVTPLCGTVEGAEVNGFLFKVAEQVTVMDFTLELMDSEEAMVTLTVPYSNGVCSYSVNATSIDEGEPLFTDKQFPPLAGEDNTVSISLQLPTSEEYYITVSACNALECGPPSNPVFISTFSVQNVMIATEGNTVNVGCFFIEGTTSIGCFTIFTSRSATMSWYSGAERHNSTAVGHVVLPHGSYNWSVFGVEITGLPEHNAAITGTLVVEGSEEIYVNQPPSVDISITLSSKEHKVCVNLGSGPEKVVLFHSLHDHLNELWSDFLNYDEDEDEDDNKGTETCFNGTSSEDAIAVFEGSVFSGETPYMEMVVMHNVPPSSTNPVPSSTGPPGLSDESSSEFIIAMIGGVMAAVLIVFCTSAVLLVLMFFRVRNKKMQGYELSYDEPGTGVQVKPSLARPNPYETAPYKPDMTVEDYTEEVSGLLRVDLPNSAVRYNRESVSIGEPLPGVSRSEPLPGVTRSEPLPGVTRNELEPSQENGGPMPSPPSPRGSSSSLVSADGASPDGGHVTSAPSPNHHSDGVDGLTGEQEKERSLSQCKQETNERSQPQERPQQDCYESDQSQDRDEERQHGRNQLQDSDEECEQQASDERDHLPQECVGECQQESDHVMFTISDRDDEPKLFQDQCVHGSSSPMVPLPNDAKHVYSSKNLQSLINEQPHQESDDEEAAAKKCEDQPTDRNEGPTTVPMTRLRKSFPVSTATRCDPIQLAVSFRSLSISELHAQDTESEDQEHLVGSLTVNKFRHINPHDSPIVRSTDALVRSGTPMSCEVEAREIDVVEEPKQFTETDETSETSGLLNTDGLRKRK